MNILNSKPGPYFREIYNDLEIKILKGELENNKESITQYILNNYS